MNTAFLWFSYVISVYTFLIFCFFFFVPSSRNNIYICSIVHYQANKSQMGSLHFRHHWGLEMEKKIETWLWLFSISPQQQRNNGFFLKKKMFLSDHFHVYSALTWHNAKKKRTERERDDSVVFIVWMELCKLFFLCW